MDIKDFAGLGEPLKKFIEVVAQGIGSINAAHLLKKKGDAASYVVKQLGQALADSPVMANASLENDVLTVVMSNVVLRAPTALSIADESETISERAFARIAYTESVKQENLESIVNHAVEQIKSDSQAADEPVDPDWITNFFDHAPNVSHEEMQKLWGKVLSGEVLRPGSYSLRTLQLLRNLSQREAQIFIKASNAVFVNSNAAFIPQLDVEGAQYQNLTSKFDLSFSDILLLQELSIVNSQLELTLTQHMGAGTNVLAFYGDTGIVINTLDPVTLPKLPVIVFTNLGKELLQLTQITPNIEFGREVVAFYRNGLPIGMMVPPATAQLNVRNTLPTGAVPSSTVQSNVPRLSLHYARLTPNGSNFDIAEILG